jgi:DNA-binding transcriptional LysR family regulator
MAFRKIDWESQVSRRITLRHLHVFATVVQHGSMAKAAGHLGVSQPTVSEVIADLEHAYGLRLLDRSPRGVEPTLYGTAFHRRTIAIFDELKQSSRDLQFLADPTVGDLRIGYQESVSAAVLVPAIRRFSARYPGVAMHTADLPSAALQLSELRARRFDCIFQLLTRSLGDEEDLNVEVLLNDRLVIAADKHSRWASRRHIDLADLVDEPWVLTPRDTWAYSHLAAAFQTRGLPMPRAILESLSVPLRAELLPDSKYITAIPGSALRGAAGRLGLKALPVELHDPPWPLVVVTLKHRTLSPVVERFVACAREVAKSTAPKNGRRST